MGHHLVPSQLREPQMPAWCLGCLVAQQYHTGTNTLMQNYSLLYACRVLNVYALKGKVAFCKV